MGFVYLFVLISLSEADEVFCDAQAGGFCTGGDQLLFLRSHPQVELHLIGGTPLLRGSFLSVGVWHIRSP